MDAPRAPLTPVERKVWHFLIDYLAKHTFQPSVREIALRFRIPSTRTVTDLLTSLQKKGYVRRAPGRSRGVVIEGLAGGSGTQPVPVVRYTVDRSTVVDDHLSLDRALIANEDCFLVRANAEDAPRHAVREGDLLLVIPTGRVAEENPVVARVGPHILVRTLVRRGASLLLLAPAPGMQDLEIGDDDDFKILGPLGLVLRMITPGNDADDEPESPTSMA